MKLNATGRHVTACTTPTGRHMAFLGTHFLNTPLWITLGCWKLNVHVLKDVQKWFLGSVLQYLLLVLSVYKVHCGYNDDKMFIFLPGCSWSFSLNVWLYYSQFGLSFELYVFAYCQSFLMRSMICFNSLCFPLLASLTGWCFGVALFMFIFSGDKVYVYWHVVVVS